MHHLLLSSSVVSEQHYIVASVTEMVTERYLKQRGAVLSRKNLAAGLWEVSKVSPKRRGFCYPSFAQFSVLRCLLRYWGGLVLGSEGF